MNNESPVGQIDQPYLRDAVAGVEWELDLGIIGKRGIGHFDKQEDVCGSRVGATIKIEARAYQGDVGLWFGV